MKVVCSSIITLMFGLNINLTQIFMALGHSGFRHGPAKTMQKGCFCVVASHGNSGNKMVKWYFSYLKSNNCVEFSVFNVFS